MSDQPTDRELLNAVEEAEGVQRGRAMHAARHAMERYRDPGSKVSAGRDLFAANTKRTRTERR